MEENIHDIMDYVSDVIDEARDQNLEIEVVTWALKAMKANPSLSIVEAINEGYEHWVK